MLLLRLLPLALLAACGSQVNFPPVDFDATDLGVRPDGARPTIFVPSPPRAAERVYDRK